ncbi:MAG: hypothetical protein HQK85_02545, partial [Nitrospinae bacterium]|nr:hypothetical protein [Nitrospinota bacterium]
MGLEIILKAFLKRITILATRMEIDTSEVFATIPMLRGVWGAALHELDRDIYSKVFADDGEETNNKIPGYTLRPTTPSNDGFPAIEQILIGDAVNHYDALISAWNMASQMGLGKKRIPFTIRKTHFLGCDGRLSSAENSKSGWILGNAVWP